MSRDVPAGSLAREPGFKATNREMFDGIAHTYDFLNHFLSLGVDILWRKKAVAMLRGVKHDTILDVATGTGDFAIAALALRPKKITGIDVSSGMLERGKKKIRKRNLEHAISLHFGDSENIPFGDNEFDAVTVGFGVRNFGDLNKGLSEMLRVLKPGGTAVILEFSRPASFPVKQIYRFYFSKVLPLAGKIVSGHRTAYSYLHSSATAFPEGKDFAQILSSCGFENTSIKRLSFGVATIYTGQKKTN